MNKNKIEYQKIGDFFLPKVCLPNDQYENQHIGKYGLLRLKYLKEHKKGYYTFLMINGSVPFELSRIDKIANERVKRLIKQMAKNENIDENLKRSNQLEWVQAMNNIKNRAEEIVFKELIYV